ncbi:hypothetical protein SPRG_10107 [Saprolegnia parasitica CBS 223.65]|uniref:RING-CH-type domain-containing protein n=1 Tax=Saprolegnia parasitica (strain CBS 223.65) TaxID=695850 RepID=A0A067CDE9_SAPPC|nr:hypothetical protein SPRG_10107 [Saprolegnia parasitica CBS 223.65]KDO24576.1 hypothetical protein SPRG_10107 [Saprolegnia parasitica CBS 223.65]|eukprot:XP_012204644.1 hypothetical protein SPRG_10107 [Saprolegnia parasitica CBS 223.65]
METRSVDRTLLPLECLRCYRRSTTDLIAPCNCASYVHRDCLDARRVLNASAVTHCKACGEAYDLYEVPSEAAEYKRRLRMAHLLRVLFVLLVVLLGCGMIYAVEESTARKYRNSWTDEDRALNEWLASIGCPRFLGHFVMSLFFTAIFMGIFIGCQRIAPTMERCINACENRFGRYSTTILGVCFVVLFIGMMRLVGLYMVLFALTGVFGAVASVGATLRFHKIHVQYRHVQDRRLHVDGANISPA